MNRNIILGGFCLNHIFFQMVSGGWFLPCLSNCVSLFCLYLRNRLSHRAGIGPILKLKQLSFRWDQPQLCSFIRLGVITNNIIYTANVPYSLFIVTVLLISRERIELQSWDWSQMKALHLKFSGLLQFFNSSQ